MHTLFRTLAVPPPPLPPGRELDGKEAQDQARERDKHRIHSELYQQPPGVPPGAEDLARGRIACPHTGVLHS